MEYAKCATLLHVIRPDAIELFNTFNRMQRVTVKGIQNCLKFDVVEAQICTVERHYLTQETKMKENQLIQ